MSDTTNTNNSTSPQDLINAALGTTTPTPTTMPSAEPQPSIELPLTSPTPTAETPAMPSELTEAPVLPTQVTMGDDTPLAFVGSTPAASTSTTEPVVEPTMPVSLGTSAPMDAVPPVVPIATLPVEPIKTQKKSKVKTILVGLALFLALVAGVGAYSYQQYGSVGALVAGVLNNEDTDCPKGKHIREYDGKCVTNDLKGGGEEKAKEKARQNANNGGDCVNNGGFWCKVTDSAGNNHEFCGDNTSGRACYKQAIEDKGITMQIGKVSCECDATDANGKCTTWSADATTEAAIDRAQTSAATKAFEKDRVNTQCQSQSGTFTTAGNKEMWICPIGTTVACTGQVTGAKRFYGNLDSFCGVVQVDTGTGHTSYSSTAGCDKPPSPVPSPIPSPSVPVVAPKLMCDGLTRTPTTTPVIGDKLTFTCTGSSVPAGSVALTYKFRSALDGGVWSSLANKTATTAEMIINACGAYKVQCQACGTISGAVVCDPVWTGATAL